MIPSDDDIDGTMTMVAAMKKFIAQNAHLTHWADSSFVLTAKVARQYLKEPQPIALLQYTSIEPSAADILSRYKDQLTLYVTTLSDASAENLGKHCGLLALNFLISISDAAAESLSRHNGFLFLNGLTALTDNAAESFSKHQDWLSLAAVRALSNSAARSLLKHTSHFSLNLKALPQSAADILRQHASFSDDEEVAEA